MPDPVRLLHAAPAADLPLWRPHLARACAERGIDVEILGPGADPAAVDFIAYDPGGGLVDFAPYDRLRAVLSLWAGVERIVGNPTIRVPLCRMVDPGLRQGMIEYVAGHVLRHHLGTDLHVLHQDGVWRHDALPPLAPERRVGVLGLGELGGACAAALAGLGFDVAGWSRTPRPGAPVPAFSGEDGLAAILARSEILVLLLPATPATEGLLDARRLALLPPGAVVINPGRGALIDDAALLAALDAGRIGHATLDVFRAEPLPPGHPFWAHPRVTVTPHIAAETRPATAAGVVAENIRRALDGEALLYEVDRARGY
jgi:glyoxylate/hydroxypyruvate reductase A